MCNLHFAIHQGSPSFYIFTHERIIMSFAITDLLLNTGGVQKPCYRSIVSNTDTFETPMAE